MNEMVLRKNAMQHLIDRFGVVDAERFISLIIKEPFDYTEWQKSLYNNLSIEETFASARNGQN